MGYRKFWNQQLHLISLIWLCIILVGVDGVKDRVGALWMWGKAKRLITEHLGKIVSYQTFFLLNESAGRAITRGLRSLSHYFTTPTEKNEWWAAWFFLSYFIEEFRRGGKFSTSAVVNLPVQDNWGHWNRPTCLGPHPSSPKTGLNPKFIWPLPLITASPMNKTACFYFLIYTCLCFGVVR